EKCSQCRRFDLCGRDAHGRFAICQTAFSAEQSPELRQIVHNAQRVNFGLFFGAMTRAVILKRCQPGILTGVCETEYFNGFAVFMPRHELSY
ncbi:putative zinc peptidase, partial [Candidatus Termititenax aidoneus]